MIQLYFFYHILINYLPSARESYNFFGLDLFFLNNRGLFIPRFSLMDFSFSYPVLEGFNYFGGSHFTPELIVLVFGSSLYAAAFISEIVLAGLKAIPGGQLEAARSLGISPGRLQAMLVAGVGLTVGSGVAVAGIIGFVGLIVPHLVRPLTDKRPSSVIVPSALAGALLVLVADVVCRILPLVTELRLGIALSLIGAPFFLMLLLRMRKGLA